jgi:hypothetical protein
MSTTPTGNSLIKWQTRKPVCTKCENTVARPKEINGTLRGVCVTHGRVDARWVGR